MQTLNLLDGTKELATVFRTSPETRRGRVKGVGFDGQRERWKLECGWVRGKGREGVLRNGAVFLSPPKRSTRTGKPQANDLQPTEKQTQKPRTDQQSKPRLKP